MKTNKIERIPHDRQWQLQEAKNRLSQVVDSALHEGPQTITLRGKPAVVVVPFEDYRKLTQPRIGLAQFFQGFRARFDRGDAQRQGHGTLPGSGL